MIPISETLVSMIQNQIAHEMKNRIIYLQIASWANTKRLKGIASYFSSQADGEATHAGWLMDLLKDANAQLAIPAILPSPANFNTGMELAALFVETEAATTDALEAISRQSDAEYNVGLGDLLQRMLREQIEEEGQCDSFSNLVALSNGDLIKLDLAMR